ncbi:VanW family protein [Planococcus sp. ISL-109]|uniref:VanW family protein n=1 Tax=Planococcus sp. ISL-109 TaxID=2819166 RepID=UPI001BE8C956|nr:VanW family protein [Planococcus sp. ISL-109]MBT2582429.1 VanW family protein [Planococcus sp. ISL-109]
MDNKQFGKVFGGVFGAAILVFGTANAGAYAVDEWIFPSAKYGEYTYIGTTDVSNMAVADAKSMFVTQAATFRESAELHVTYLDETAQYPLKDVEISLDETMERAQSGSQNHFIFDLSESQTRSFLKKQFNGIPFTEADIANIHLQLEDALEGGQAVSRADISSDALEMRPDVVAQTSFSHSLETADALQVLESLDGTVLAPNETFSFLTTLEELTLLEATDAELTEIASAIYGAMLRTNFLVEQRSIGESVPENVPAGEEAAINRSLGVDFAFSNPNASSFTLNTYVQNGELMASIHGLPFVHIYDISIASDVEIEPRLIKQFSAFVSSGNEVREEGRDGKRIEVVRAILEDGKEVEVEPVSSDFYPPVHRVEVYPLTQPEAPATEGDTVVDWPVPGDPDFVDINNNGIHDAAELTYGEGDTIDWPVPGDPDFIDTNNNGIHDPAELTYEEGTILPDGTVIPGTEGDDSANPSSGGENNPETDDDTNSDKEAQYDKGGKRVQP